LERERPRSRARAFLKYVGAQPVTPEEHWLWTHANAITKHGYAIFSMSKFSKQPSKPAHMVAYFLFHDSTFDLDSGTTINHRCHERLCVNPAHLVPMTQFEQHAHKEDRVLGVVDRMILEYPAAQEPLEAAKAIISQHFAKLVLPKR
jgi:hypothetical protein